MKSSDDKASSSQSGTSKAVNSWWERNRFRIYIGSLVILLLLVYLWPLMFITVPAGHRGVMYRRLGNGTVTSRIWGEGVYIIPPWDVLTIYETRIQQVGFAFAALTRDGLRIDLDITVRYRPQPDALGYLHKEIGEDYLERVIKPEIKAALRRTVGDKTAYELYSTEGDVLQRALVESIDNIEIVRVQSQDSGVRPNQQPIASNIGPAAVRPDSERNFSKKRLLKIEALVIEKITLPPIVQTAIDNKHRQEQILLEYEFRLQREGKEAERKRTEAEGIRDYNAIIEKQGISDDVLRWRGIDATVELAKSSNSKMIVIGGGDSGLPVILDATGKGVEQTTPPPAGGQVAP